MRHALILLFFSSGLVCADGRFEINQLCVASGCFTGDDPGWPVEITEPGSYRLTSNLNVGSFSDPVDGIQIFSSDVTLDLGGFTIGGPVVCIGDEPVCFTSNSKHGIRSIGQPNPILRNAKIFNGSVQGFDIECIDLAGIRNFEISDLRISDCGSRGIRALSPSGVIDRVHITNTGDAGIFTNSRNKVTRSTFYNTGNVGVDLGICEGNTFNENGDAFSNDEESCSVLLENNICSGAPC